MNNPYENLYIYYFNGTPEIPSDIERQPHYLGSWEDDDICFLFFSQPADAYVDAVVKVNPDIRLVEQYEMTGEQWHGDKIEPYTIANLCIYPPWGKPALTSKDAKSVMLDPGVVFGTGRHQTTEDCLELICRLCSKEKIDSMMDIGTGTGLLAVAAAALGCRRVMACDFNCLAVKTAWNNVKMNRFEDRVLAFQARGEQVLNITSDLLVANIHYDIMRHIIEEPALLKNKWFILSGLLNTETRKVLESLSEKSVQIIERRCPDGVWNTILGRPL